MNVRILLLALGTNAANISFKTLEMRRELWNKYHRLKPSVLTINDSDFQKSAIRNTQKFRKRSGYYSTDKLCKRFQRNYCIFRKTILQKTFWNKYYLADSHKSPILQNLIS